MDMNSADRIEEYSQLTSEKYLTDLKITDEDDDDKDESNSAQMAVSYQSGAAAAAAKAHHVSQKSVDSGSGFIGSIDLETGLSQPSTDKRGGYFEMATLALKEQQMQQQRSGTPLIGLMTNGVSGKWPSAGNVAFEHIYMAYKANAAPVLR